MSTPLAVPPGNLLNSVMVKMSVADYLVGLASIALTMACDRILASPSTPNVANEFMGNLIGGGSIKEWAMKQGLGVATGLMRVLATGEGSVQIGVGSPYLGLTVGGGTTQVANADGTSSTAYQYGYTSQAGPVQGQLQRQHNPDGTTQTQATLTGGSPVSNTSAQRTTTYDSQGRMTSDSRSDTTSVMHDGASGTANTTTTTTYDPATGNRTGTTTTTQSTSSVGGPLGGADQSRSTSTTRDASGSVTESRDSTSSSVQTGPGNVGGHQLGELHQSNSGSTVTQTSSGTTTTTTHSSSTTGGSAPGNIVTGSQTTSQTTTTTTSAGGGPSSSTSSSSSSSDVRIFGEPL
jgi:hypothetical protein